MKETVVIVFAMGAIAVGSYTYGRTVKLESDQKRIEARITDLVASKEKTGEKRYTFHYVGKEARLLGSLVQAFSTRVVSAQVTTAARTPVKTLSFGRYQPPQPPVLAFFFLMAKYVRLNLRSPIAPLRPRAELTAPPFWLTF